METQIVEQLKTGRIKNVFPYGVEHNADAPYIIVKPEADGLGIGTRYRIIVHFNPGQQIFLRQFVYNDLFDLMDNFTAQVSTSGVNTLLTENNYTDIIVSNDDNTISMERTFLLPRVIL